MTSKSKLRLSIGSLFYLAYYYLTPVKNDCVKKKPEIQNVGGASVSTHFYKNSNLFTRSKTYPPKGFKELYETSCHKAGILLASIC